jgi:5'-3' exonuclease
MGIKGLFAFLKRWEQTRTIEAATKDASVGIDLFWFLYQTRGDVPALLAHLAPFFEHSRAIHVVLDGSKMTQERRAVVEERRDQRQETIEIIEEIQMAPMLEERDQRVLEKYVEQLKRRAWKPTREYIDQITECLIKQGAIIHWSSGEADQTLIELEKTNVIDRIVTNDSDLIVGGAETVLCPIKNGVRQLSKSHLIQQMGFTIQQWDDFMWMVSRVDVLVAYSMIRVYKEEAKYRLV